MSETHSTIESGGQGPTPPVGKLKVFISYSRADAHFADELTLALADKGFEPLIDRHGIDAGEEWKARLGELIEACDTVVFILTETSAKSAICAWEVEQAAQLSKRMFVVTPGAVPAHASTPPQLAGINWVHCWRNPDIPGSSYQKGVLILEAALRLDLAWVRQQTAIQEQASRWIARERTNRSHLLLRGELLQEALDWALRAPKGAKIPSEIEAFIASSEAVAHDLERVLHGVNASMVGAKVNLEVVRDTLLLEQSDPHPSGADKFDSDRQRRIDRVRRALTSAIALIDDLDFQLKKVQRDHYDIRDHDGVCSRFYSNVLQKVISAAAGIAFVNSQPPPRFSGMDDARKMPAVRGSESVLTLVFRNLVENSIKYAAPERPPAVIFRFVHTDTHIQIHMQDNGIGIPDDELTLVFKDGFRGTKARRLSFRGAGVGLADCRRILVRSGGALEVAPCATGTHFIVSLALATSK